MPGLWLRCWEVSVLDRREFLEILAEQIRTKRARPMIITELETHIEDQKTAYMAEGMTSAEAEEAAVKEMGDPVETGIRLDRIHRPKMEWRVFIGALLMGVMGIVLQGIVVASQYSIHMAGRREMILHSVERQALGMVLGILLMLLICYLDYSLLAKYAFPLWILMNVFMVACILYGMGSVDGVGFLFGPLVNGKAVRAATVSYVVIPFYGGTVYHFRGQGGRGLMKSIACFLVSLAVISKIPSLVSVCVVGATGVIMLSLAVHKKWFGENRKKLYLELWGTLVAVSGGLVVLTAVFNGYILSDYQSARLAAWGSREVWDYPMILVTRAAASAKDGGTLAAEGVMDVVTYIKNDYLWKYLFEYLGSAKGVFLILIFFSFMVLLFRMAFRQKNRLGYIISVGCTVYLAFQAILYVGMNFGFVPIGGTYMPFLSNGNSALLSTYFYMGLLLSVYRNSNVVRN